MQDSAVEICQSSAAGTSRRAAGRYAPGARARRPRLAGRAPGAFGRCRGIALLGGPGYLHVYTNKGMNEQIVKSISQSISLSLSLYICIDMNTDTYKCVHICGYVYMCMYIHTCMHACHRYMHTCNWVLFTCKTVVRWLTGQGGLQF